MKKSFSSQNILINSQPNAQFKETISSQNILINNLKNSQIQGTIFSKRNYNNIENAISTYNQITKENQQSNQLILNNNQQHKTINELFPNKEANNRKDKKIDNYIFIKKFLKGTTGMCLYIIPK